MEQTSTRPPPGEKERLSRPREDGSRGGTNAEGHGLSRDRGVVLRLRCYRRKKQQTSCGEQRRKCMSQITAKLHVFDPQYFAGLFTVSGYTRHPFLRVSTRNGREVYTFSLPSRMTSASHYRFQTRAPQVIATRCLAAVDIMETTGCTIH